MIVNETFSILFYLKKSKVNKKGETPIYCRISVNGERSEVTTKRFSKPALWNSKVNNVRGTSSEAKAINEHLRIIKNKLHDCQSLLFEKNHVITAKKIKNLFLGKDDSVGVLEYKDPKAKSEVINLTNEIIGIIKT